MLDPSYIRDHVEEGRQGLRNRRLDPDKVLEEIDTLASAAGAATTRSFECGQARAPGALASRPTSCGVSTPELPSTPRGCLRQLRSVIRNKGRARRRIRPS